MRIVSYVAFSLTAVLAAFLAPVSGAIAPEEAIAAIEGAQEDSGGEYDGMTLAEVMEAAHVPGASVAVIWDHKIHWAKGYGVADVETGREVDAETLFQAASISKPVAAMASLKAVEDGLFSLDDDINTILTSWKLPENKFTEEVKVTPAMLLSHTGGTTVHGFPGYHPTRVTIPTAVQVLIGERPANTKPVVVDTVPGTLWRYSGGGTTVMQVALSDVVGMHFPEIVKSWVLDPIGMTNSGYDQPLTEARQANDSRAHNAKGRKMAGKWHVYPELAAAGNWTTPTDLGKFAIEVERSIHGRSNKVLSAEIVGMMISPPLDGTYGLGLSVMKHGDDTYFGHGGSNWGFKCDMIMHRDKGYGAAVMTNSESGFTVVQEVMQRIRRTYEWGWVEEESK